MSIMTKTKTAGMVNKRKAGGAPKSKAMLPKPARTPRGLGPADGESRRK